MPSRGISAYSVFLEALISITAMNMNFKASQVLDVRSDWFPKVS